MSNTSCIELVSILILGNLNISCQSDLIYLNKETNLAVRRIGTLLPTVADRSGSLTKVLLAVQESLRVLHGLDSRFS